MKVQDLYSAALQLLCSFSPAQQERSVGARATTRTIAHYTPVQKFPYLGEAVEDQVPWEVSRKTDRAPPCSFSWSGRWAAYKNYLKILHLCLEMRLWHILQILGVLVYNWYQCEPQYECKFCLGNFCNISICLQFCFPHLIPNIRVRKNNFLFWSSRKGDWKESQIEVPLCVCPSALFYPFISRFFIWKSIVIFVKTFVGLGLG